MSEGNGLITTIEIRDDQGQVISTREAVTYAGLLNRAHQEGLKQIRTTLVQAPSAANEMTAISMAEVVTEKGVFTDYGDANPRNVDAMIVPHIIRMSVTRAKARALRDAINVGVVSFEELCQEFPNGNGGKLSHGVTPQTNGHAGNGPTRQKDRDLPMTEHQRKYLFRLLADRDIDAERAEVWLCEELDITVMTAITKKQASDMINLLVQEASPQPEIITEERRSCP